jgi:hypothetical protein
MLRKMGIIAADLGDEPVLVCSRRYLERVPVSADSAACIGAVTC